MMGECFQYLGQLDEAEQYYQHKLWNWMRIIWTHMLVWSLDDLQEDHDRILNIFAQALPVYPHDEDSLSVTSLRSKMMRHGGS